jgi:opine dehydrogenase
VIVAVSGTGPGGMAIAADMAADGRDVVLADLPEFGRNLEAIRERGGVTVMSPYLGPEVVSVTTAGSIEDAVSTADLVVVSVPASAHQRFVEVIVPHLRPEAALLFMGEGSGSLVAWPALKSAGKATCLVGETNCLPFIARSPGRGTITVDRKLGGVLVAALPARRTAEIRERIVGIWPFVEAAESVLHTTLVNYDAIDIVPVAVANAGTIEARSGGMLLWGEGATPSVVRLIEAVDGELLDLRETLGSRDSRRYRDFLIAQGLAPDAGDLYAVMRAGGIVRSFRPSGGTEYLEARLALEIPWSLRLAASIGDAAGVATPVIDALIAVGGAMLGRDGWKDEGRTLAALGLDGLDTAGLRRFAETGQIEDPSDGSAG